MLASKHNGIPQHGFAGLVGKSRAMQQVYELIRRLANTDASVLLTGESGTGKELVARALHAYGDRASRAFVAINCAAVPGNLLESELFGHVKGAFTDARTTRKGLLYQARGGTVLLDEIGEMPLDMQAKLLRVVQDKRVRPLGSNAEERFDARLVSATNHELDVRVRKGKFREDLYYRLNVVQISLPPLRERGSDVALLAKHFLRVHAARLDKPVRKFDAAVLEKLEQYDWPGNVRQLENCIERAVALCGSHEVSVQHLPPKIRRHQLSAPAEVDFAGSRLPTLEQLEHSYLQHVLDVAKGNKTHAARILGVDRRTLYRKLERLERRRAEKAGQSKNGGADLRAFGIW